MNKKKVYLSIIILIIIAAIVFVCFFFPKRISEKEVYIGSGPIDWAPISQQLDNSLVGVAPSLASSIMRDLGLKAEYKPIGTDADFYIAERFGNKKLTYSKSYISDEIVIFVKIDKTFGFESLADLQDKKGVIMADISYGQKINEFVDDNSKIVEATSVEEALSLLDNDQTDYFLYTNYASDKLLTAEGYKDKYARLGNIALTADFYFAFPKNSPLIKYLPQINELIDKYQADGTIMQLIISHEAR